MCKDTQISLDIFALHAKHFIMVSGRPEQKSLKQVTLFFLGSGMIKVFLKQMQAIDCCREMLKTSAKPGQLIRAQFPNLSKTPSV